MDQEWLKNFNINGYFYIWGVGVTPIPYHYFYLNIEIPCKISRNTPRPVHPQIQELAFTIIRKADTHKNASR